MLRTFGFVAVTTALPHAFAMEDGGVRVGSGFEVDAIAPAGGMVGLTAKVPAKAKVTNIVYYFKESDAAASGAAACKNDKTDAEIKAFTKDYHVYDQNKEYGYQNKKQCVVDATLGPFMCVAEKGDCERQKQAGWGTPPAGASGDKCVDKSVCETACTKVREAYTYVQLDLTTPATPKCVATKIAATDPKIVNMSPLYFEIPTDSRYGKTLYKAMEQCTKAITSDGLNICPALAKGKDMGTLKCQSSGITPDKTGAVRKTDWADIASIKYNATTKMWMTTKLVAVYQTSMEGTLACNAQCGVPAAGDLGVFWKDGANDNCQKLTAGAVIGPNDVVWPYKGQTFKDSKGTVHPSWISHDYQARSRCAECEGQKGLKNPKTKDCNPATWA